MLGGQQLQDSKFAGGRDELAESPVEVPEVLAEGDVSYQQDDKSKLDSQHDEVLFEALLPVFAHENITNIQASIQQLHQRLGIGHKDLSGHDQHIGVITEHLQV